MRCHRLRLQMRRLGLTPVSACNGEGFGLPREGFQLWAQGVLAPGSLPYLSPDSTTSEINLIRLQAQAEEIKIASCTNKS